MCLALFFPLAVTWPLLVPQFHCSEGQRLAPWDAPSSTRWIMHLPLNQTICNRTSKFDNHSSSHFHKNAVTDMPLILFKFSFFERWHFNNILNLSWRSFLKIPRLWWCQFLGLLLYTPQATRWLMLGHQPSLIYAPELFLSCKTLYPLNNSPYPSPQPLLTSILWSWLL